MISTLEEANENSDSDSELEASDDDDNLDEEEHVSDEGSLEFCFFLCRSNIILTFTMFNN